MVDSYIMEKIMFLPRKFREHMQRKEYPSAKHCYDTAITVVVFLELPRDVRDKLFGYWKNDDIYVPGMFNDELVQKAYYECAVKRNLGSEQKQYEAPPWKQQNKSD